MQSDVGYSIKMLWIIPIYIYMIMVEPIQKMKVVF